MHTQSLVVMGFELDKKTDVELQQQPQAKSAAAESSAEGTPAAVEDDDGATLPVERPIAVVEQRVSNLVQGTACLVMMTGPFLKLLHWVPKGVLAGLFVRASSTMRARSPGSSALMLDVRALPQWLMGSDALAGSGVTALILFLIKDKTLTAKDDPLLRVRKSRVWTWLAMELAGFAATFVRPRRRQPALPLAVLVR